MMHTVYELRDNGKVVNVGQTKRDLQERLYEHTCKRQGKFYGQRHLTIHAICELPKRDALTLEAQLKLKYNIPLTEAGSHRRKLNREQVLDIRTKRIKGQDFAKLYNVTNAVISGIQHNKLYVNI